MQLVFLEPRFQRNNSNYENECLKKTKDHFRELELCTPWIVLRNNNFDGVLYAQTAVQRSHNE